MSITWTTVAHSNALLSYGKKGRDVDTFDELRCSAIVYYVERGSSVVECRIRNQVSPGSNPALLPCRILGIFVLSIDAPVDSAV